MTTSVGPESDVPATGSKRVLAATLRPLGAAWSAVNLLRMPAPEADPFVAGETRIAKVMWPSALAGAVGSLLVLWGASQPTSPFTLNHATLSTLPGPLQSGVRTWYFGTEAVGGHGDVLVGVVAVYAGMFLMIKGWMGLIRVTRLHPGTPVRHFVPLFIVWMLPLLVVAPLFSHDAYSYAAQGEEITRHINPYIYSPAVLGVGGNPWASGVDTLWGSTTSPYGPVFLWLAGAVVGGVNHNYLASVAGFRLLAVAGVVLLAVYAPRLARSYGHDPARAFVLAALSPLVLLHLVAGEHNDALMIGLLVAGLALARERHPIIGIILCSLAGLVKVPGLVGVVYVAWDWSGGGTPVRGRLKLTAAGLAISGITLAVVTEAIVLMTRAVGSGWGWVSALWNPSSVNSWMDPATGLGTLLGKVVNGVGLGMHVATIVSVSRALGLLGAAAIGLWLLLRADGVGSLRGVGLTLLAFAALGPVVQPWYLVWGLVVLAPIAAGLTRSAIVAVSAVFSFLGLPGGRMLLRDLGRASPLLIAAAVAALALVGLLSLTPRIRQLLRERRARAADRLAEDKASVPAGGT
ncbi:MAG: polyprenol phosphomannose-dependent alpha 1,6 mannosyltransferase MptB [Acidimicrobiales bacterium]